MLILMSSLTKGFETVISLTVRCCVQIFSRKFFLFFSKKLLTIHSWSPYLMIYIILRKRQTSYTIHYFFKHNFSLSVVYHKKEKEQTLHI